MKKNSNSGDHPDGTITQLLAQFDDGDEESFSRLIEAVYVDLCDVAEGRLRGRFGTQYARVTMVPEALAHDTIEKLMQQRTTAANSGQFFAIATRLMMQVLTDYQRHRLADKRGGGRRGERLPDDLQESDEPEDISPGESSELMDALGELQMHDARKAEVVTLHIGAGLSLSRVAELLGLSTPTAERDWRFARAWLADRIGHNE